MKKYAYEAQFVQTIVNAMDQCILVLRSLPIVNPVYAQQLAALIGEIKTQSDAQDAANSAPEVTP